MDRDTSTGTLTKKLIFMSIGEFTENAVKGAGVAFGVILMAKKLGVLPLNKK